jgi:hypothetical protein
MINSYLIHFKMKDVHDDICFVVQQNDVSSDYDVCAVRRRRRQTPHQFLGTGLDAFLEACRKRAAPHELLFQTGRQLIFLGQPGGRCPSFS